MQEEIEAENKLTLKDIKQQENKNEININECNRNSDKYKKIYRDKYSEEEKEKCNKMIFSNQLIQNQSLLSHFGAIGKDPFTHFYHPFYITYNDKLNIIAVSDYDNYRVKIMD